MNGIRFIHAADLHLDSPMVGLRHLPKEILTVLQNSTFQALDNLVSAALFHQVDFVILAGDLFDQEDRSIRAQSQLKKQMQRLEAGDIPVYIVHGNHDSLGGRFAHLELPQNVQVFSETVEMKKLKTRGDEVVHLYGFSYGTRHITERKIADYMKHPGADYHIGILHGNMEGNTEHGNYAPFTVTELLEKEFDYWALGHIHKRSVLSESPPIVYPGNIQGRNRKETGDKGVYLVELGQTKANLTFIRTNTCMWLEKELSGREWTQFDDMYVAIRRLLEAEREEGISKLLSIQLIELPSEIMTEQNQFENLLDALQEEEAQETSFVWPYQIRASEMVNYDRQELTLTTDFYGEMFRVFESMTDPKEALASLYQHPTARKLLPELTENEYIELLKESEKLLVTLLMKD